MPEKNRMRSTSRFTLIIFFILSLAGCSKKTTPTTTNTSKPAEKTDSILVVTKTDSVAVKKVDSVIVIKPVVKPKVKKVTPKVIVVNDNVARKSVDGRLYYDLDGHRYWRNYKDGKYYLFNKSMNTDEAFKKPD